MYDLAELRRQVDAAQRRFAEWDRQHRAQSERLAAAVQALEAAFGDKEREAARLSGENRELRALLHEALLLGLNAAGEEKLSEALAGIEARVAALGSKSPAASAPAAPGGADEERPAGPDELFRAALTGNEAVASIIERIQRQHGPE